MAREEENTLARAVESKTELAVEYTTEPAVGYTTEQAVEYTTEPVGSKTAQEQSTTEREMSLRARGYTTARSFQHSSCSPNSWPVCSVLRHSSVRRYCSEFASLRSHCCRPGRCQLARPAAPLPCWACRSVTLVGPL